MEHVRFTVSEANALLPELKKDLYRLQSLVKRFEEKYQELEKKKAILAQSSAGFGLSKDPFFEDEGQLEFFRMEVDLLVANFARKGVLLKMITPGLIDFPAVLDGEEILICWKEGEESINHYHGWNDGFAGRKPLPDVSL